MVSGLDGIGEIGPIPVVASDTIREVEAKVQAWIAENVGDFEAPEEGVLGLALEGKSLESGTSLYDQQVSDMSTFQVPAKQLDEEGHDEEEQTPVVEEGPLAYLCKREVARHPGDSRRACGLGSLGGRVV